MGGVEKLRERKVCVCMHVCETTWPNSQGTGLLIERLQVRFLLKTLWCCGRFLEQETLVQLFLGKANAQLSLSCLEK